MKLLRGTDHPVRLFALMTYFILATVTYASPVRGDDITMAFPTYQPPFTLIGDADNRHDREGIWLDIVREALAYKGHTLTPKILPYNRFASELQARHVSAVSIVKGELPPLFVAEETVYFKNFVITHKDLDREIKSLKDLAGLELVSWQGAKSDLGKAFSDIVPTLAFYREIAYQDTQVRVFVRHRVDAVILDENIFKYFARKNGHSPDEYVYNDVVGGYLRFSAGFLSERIRDDFNEGLKSLKSSGRYDAIYHFYSQEY